MALGKHVEPRFPLSLPRSMDPCFSGIPARKTMWWLRKMEGAGNVSPDRPSPGQQSAPGAHETRTTGALHAPYTTCSDALLIQHVRPKTELRALWTCFA